MRDEKAWKWLNESELGYDIWEKKYRYNNESFDGWLNRVSSGNEEYKRLIEDKLFLPAGRILSNKGLHKYGLKVTYSNCYVQDPPSDSIESIFDCAKEIARTFSYGGGVGIDISKLAPRGAKVNNTAKETSGAVSFMDLYSMVTGLIGQNGRRGALMISLDCHHPDLEEFIDVKTDLNKVTKANISVRITDDFMNAVINDEDFELSFVREESKEEIKKTVRAKEIYHKFCENNWNYAEPGMIYWDNVRKWNILSNNDEFEYAGVNPCQEEPLPAGGSCLLGSINLSEFVHDPFTIGAGIELEKLDHTVRVAVRFLNDILDEGLMLHPLAKQRQTVGDWRQIGLGVMGAADMLIKLGYKYGGQNAVTICDNLSKFIANIAINESATLAKEKGAFAKCNIEQILNSPFVINNAADDTKDLIRQYGLRNSQLLTIPPTGTLSTMLGISGGMEPVFANSYTRKTESLHGEDIYYKVYTPIVEQYMKANYIDDESELPEYFVTAKDIDPIDRIKMQAAFQGHIDASISSTINLPNEATIEDVEHIYMEAWKHDLKGITIYRAGCKREGILVEDKPAVEEVFDATEPSDISFVELPRGYVVDVSDDLIGYKRKLNTGCGSLHLEVYSDELTGEPQETFINIGSSGGCERNYQFISRLISTALRGGIPIEAIVDQAKSIRPCNAYVSRTKSRHDTSPGTSCPSAIGLALQDLYNKTKGLYVPDEILEEECDACESSCCSCERGDLEHTDTTNHTDISELIDNMICPECGARLQSSGGCVICMGDDKTPGCGWSKCD